MRDDKQEDKAKEPEEPEPAKEPPRPPERRERTFWTEDADNPLICRGID